MTELEASAPLADPNPVETTATVTDDQTEGQAEGQTAEDAPEGEQSEEKSRSKERREREKALKERLRQEADDAKREAQRLREREKRILEAADKVAAPDEKQFADYTEFVAAKAAWTVRRDAAQANASMIADDAKEIEARIEGIAAQEKQIIEEGWQAQVADARAIYTDFDAVVTNPRVPITEGMAALIKASDVAAHVAYQLASNPARAAEIARLPPLEQARAIGRIEAQVAAPKPRETNALPPITPVTAKASPGKSPENMSMEDYIAWAQKRR